MCTGPSPSSRRLWLCLRPPKQLGVFLCPPLLLCHVSTSALTACFPRSLSSRPWAEQVNAKAKGKEGPSFPHRSTPGRALPPASLGEAAPRQGGEPGCLLTVKGADTQETLGWRWWGGHTCDKFICPGRVWEAPWVWEHLGLQLPPRLGWAPGRG